MQQGIGLETCHTMGSKSPRTLIWQNLLSTRDGGTEVIKQTHAQKIVDDTLL